MRFLILIRLVRVLSLLCIRRTGLIVVVLWLLFLLEVLVCMLMFRGLLIMLFSSSISLGFRCLFLILFWGRVVRSVVCLVSSGMLRGLSCRLIRSRRGRCRCVGRLCLVRLNMLLTVLIGRIRIGYRLVVRGLLRSWRLRGLLMVVLS